MSKNIVEQNPVQQSKAPSGPQGQGAGGGEERIRKQARQLAYDVRYKVKQGFKKGQKADPASLKRAYVQQLGKSPAPGPVKQLAKKMLIGEEYDFIEIDNSINNAMSNVMNKVFVEGIVEEESEPLEEDGKYKVRVTDKKSKKSYVRMADREKISQLRKNPNISSVEMTGYGTPYDKAISKKKAKKDFDGDGKVESPKAEYKGSKDKAIKNAVAKEGYQRDPERLKKDKTHSKQPDPSKDGFTGIGNMSIKDIMKMNKKMKKEEFMNEVIDKTIVTADSTKKIDVMKGKNKIKINPNVGEQVEVNDEDPTIASKEKRVSMMKKQILLKKMQAVRSGAGADIVAHHEPEGDTIEESEKVAQGAQKRATELGAKRRQASYKKYGSNVGSPGKNERAGYNLARKARSADSSPETQVTKKKRPAGSDTSQIGHERKRDEKTDVGKSGKKLKTSKHKLSFKDRQTHHTRSAFNRKDPKQNPKHTANTQKEEVKSLSDTIRGILDERLGGKGYKPYKSLTGKKVSGDWEDSDRGAGNKAKKRAGGKVEKKSPTYQAYVLNKEHHQVDANGKVIEHGDGTPSSVEEAKKKGLDGKACWKGYKLAGTKKKGGKTVDDCVKVEEQVKDIKGGYLKKEDKAFNYVLDKIKKEVGKSGYVSKDNPRKPQSAADKAKVRAHQAKVDKENAAARAKDPSQGRYPKG